MSTKDRSMDQSPVQAPKSSQFRSFKSNHFSFSKKLFPLWLLEAASHKRSWRRLSRCWLASWVCFILLLSNRSREAMGSAAFFVCIAGFLQPPNLPLQLYCFSVSTLLVGCFVGWAWGCAGIVAAGAARNKVLLESDLRATQQAAAGQANPDAYYSQAIFQGEYLDTRSTVVFGVFLGTGVFAMGFLRAKVPKLTATSIFGSLFLNITCSYGPLFPFRNYLVVRSFLVSCLTAVAVNLASVVLIFPETLSYEWLENYAGVLGSVKSLVDMQEVVLTDDHEKIKIDAEDGTLAQVNTTQERILDAFQAMSSRTAMLNLEFSYGRLSGGDVKNLEVPLRALLMRARGLSSFASQYAHHLCTRADSIPSSSSFSSATAPLKTNIMAEAENPSQPKRLVLRARDTHLLLHVRGYVTALEIAQHTRISDLIPILYATTTDLRAALSGALGATIAAVQDINKRRYKVIQTGPLRELCSARDGLKGTLAEYRAERRVAIVQSLANAVDAAQGRMLDEHGRPTVSFRPLFVCFTFESNLCWTADAVLALMEVFIRAMEERKRNHLWAPTGLRNIMKMLRLGEGTDQITKDEDLIPQSGMDDPFSRQSYRDPDARPAVTVVQHLTHTMWRVWKFWNTKEAGFATKYTILSIALWLPAVCKSSAAFAYREKALWSLFMSQLAMSLYMSDQIGQMVSRLLGTIAGGIVGLVIWYIGAGRGYGNPYGLAAAHAVFLVPLLFVRLFWTQRVAETTMAGVTTMLVLGYSWVDTHMSPSANLGYGYQIFWRRILSVLIGLTAAFITMLLPPQSNRKAIRLGNASTLSEIAHIYSFLISSWLTVEEAAEDEYAPEERDWPRNGKFMFLPSYNKWAPAFRAKVLTIASHLGAQKARMGTVKWENNIRGEWPGQHYKKLLEIQTSMISDLVQLAGSLMALSPTWRNRLLHRTAFLNPNLISDVMAIFGLVSMSLETGRPVHEALPSNLLDRSIYHDQQSRSAGANFRQLDQTDNEKEPDSTLIVEERITGKQVMSIEYSMYATGVSASFHLLHSLDEIHLITKELCGEIPLNGFERWREEYELKRLDHSV